MSFFVLPIQFPANPLPSPVIILLLFISMLALASAPPPPPPPPPGGCAAELVEFSPCLPYISAPPNNLSSSVSSQCCSVFSSAFENGVAGCLCYLIRQPLLLGFPLNETRILSLSSLCPLRNASSRKSRTSLESLCLGSPALPPLHSNATSPGTQKAFDSGPAKSPSPLMSTPLTKSAESSPTPPSSSEDHSSATNQINNSSSWFLLEIMISIALIFTCM